MKITGDGVKVYAYSLISRHTYGDVSIMLEEVLVVIMIIILRTGGKAYASRLSIFA